MRHFQYVETPGENSLAIPTTELVRIHAQVKIHLYGTL